MAAPPRFDINYFCEDHGAIGAAIIFVSVNTGSGVRHSPPYCFECYAAMIDKHCHVATPAPLPDASGTEGAAT